MSSHRPDVYTLAEIARAVGVPAAAVRVFVTSKQLRPIGRGGFFAEADVLRLAPELRALSAGSTILGEPVLFSPPLARRREPLPLVASVGAQGLLLALALWLSADAAHTRNAPGTEPARMVFLSIPGPGGGGGGSGARQLPAPRLERAAGLRAAVATPPAALTSRSKTPDATPPKPAVERATSDAAAKPPEPLPSRSIIAPVVMTASDTRDRDGIVDARNPGVSNAQGVGTGGRSGSGQGEGNGDGFGSGLGAGSGGGTGGGAYRPGTGIEAPRLLREVKADYTEAARRRHIEGEVDMEIVVNRDGSVGQVTVTRGLGEGLDQRAVAAVRQWQFAPARRRGEAIDVVVDVSVEFTLR
jgi:protein TonB